MIEVASGPDVLRLLAIPFFGYVAWLDIRTRRVPNRTWLPLLALAVVALVWDIYRVTVGDIDPALRQEFYIQLVISLGFVIPLSYVFWRIGGFGGADAKAFMVIAVLFPAFPSYELWRWSFRANEYGWLFEVFPGATYTGTLPLVTTALGVFSVTILSNTVVMGALYPVGLAVKNAATGYFSPGMFVAKPVRWNAVTDEYGTLIQTRDERGVSRYLSFQGLDLDALRMYLRWRGATLEQIRAHTEFYRNPASIPETRTDPGDGGIPVGGWNNEATETDLWGPLPLADDVAVDDEWGAAAFLDDIEGTAYGTSPERLREGLDALVSDDVVWISPGIPFLVPLFVGLVLAFVYGDVLFALFEAIGLGP